MTGDFRDEWKEMGSIESSPSSRSVLRSRLLVGEGEVENVEVELLRIVLREKDPSNEELLDLEVRCDRLGHGERRNDGSNLEEIGMVAYLPELHEAVGDGEEVSGREGFPSLRPGHELVVEKPLTFGESAVDDVFEFSWKLLLDVGLESSKEIGSKEGVKPSDGCLGLVAHLSSALDGLVHGI